MYRIKARNRKDVKTSNVALAAKIAKQNSRLVFGEREDLFRLCEHDPEFDVWSFEMSYNGIVACTDNPHEIGRKKPLNFLR